VIWSNPATGATGVAASATPVFTDTDGPVYAPVIRIGVSEAVERDDGQRCVGHAGARQRRSRGSPAQPSTAPSTRSWCSRALRSTAGEYVATVTTAIADRAGNRLAAPQTVRFTVGAPVERVFLPAVQRIGRVGDWEIRRLVDLSTKPISNLSISQSPSTLQLPPLARTTGVAYTACAKATDAQPGRSPYACTRHRP
jgi:hypothetical protein